MTDSDRNVFLHFVWATKYRQATFPLEIEREVHRVLNSEARKLGCKILAVNGTDDHLHLLIQMGPQVTLARLMNQMKGVTTLFINDRRPCESEALFKWQNGYGVYSIGKNQVAIVVDYIARQKEHHAANTIWASLEPKPIDLIGPAKLST